MTDAAAERVTSTKLSLWSGRANRKEYWTWMGVMFAIAIVAQLIGLESGGSALAGIVAVAQARRLRDFGWSGWWAAAILAAQLIVGIALGVSMKDREAITGAAALATLIPLVILGCIPGNPGENRFGPAPGKPALKDVFS